MAGTEVIVIEEEEIEALIGGAGWLLANRGLPVVWPTAIMGHKCEPAKGRRAIADFGLRLI